MTIILDTKPPSSSSKSPSQQVSGQSTPRHSSQPQSITTPPSETGAEALATGLGEDEQRAKAKEKKEKREKKVEARRKWNAAQGSGGGGGDGGVGGEGVGEVKELR